MNVLELLLELFGFSVPRVVFVSEATPKPASDLLGLTQPTATVIGAIIVALTAAGTLLFNKWQLDKTLQADKERQEDKFRRNDAIELRTEMRKAAALCLTNGQDALASAKNLGHATAEPVNEDVAAETDPILKLAVSEAKPKIDEATRAQAKLLMTFWPESPLAKHYRDLLGHLRTAYYWAVLSGVAKRSATRHGKVVAAITAATKAEAAVAEEVRRVLGLTEPEDLRQAATGTAPDRN